MSNIITPQRHPEDDWALVELFRWQYGELPKSGDDRGVDVPVAIQAMADAFARNARDKDHMKPFPSPQNIHSVLEFCGRRIRSLEGSKNG